ncbi:uncharacterized protein LOC100679373 isoform X3 [Nasonia vitripennis]|uniref:Uncharacterized protein n=1 Tax=Nasonia vitripennis TaxID=7425 RepID=A0A7M7QAI4_NASVI|nr:uncharacterized protein LOC100679373 isoform X3 [Nasonia vitripennis]
MALRICLYTCAPFVHCRIRAAEQLEVLQSPRSGLEESMNITGMGTDCSERDESYCFFSPEFSLTLQGSGNGDESGGLALNRLPKGSQGAYTPPDPA